ncbi:OmpA family protein [Rhodospirillum sp. A1_3_36]|uniref:OmpA family protein n=1 Tax=Rhodospirillum sp. A1_3_36 TaxID=3391666 RepID=UPI0039A4C174
MRQDSGVSKTAMSIAVAGLLMLGTAVLGGCSSSGSPAAQNADTAAGDFPDVNKVPDQRPMPPTTEELSSVTQGLVADRQAARYAQDGTRRASQEISGPGPESTAPPTTVGSNITAGTPMAPTSPRVVTSPTVPPMTGTIPGPVAGGTTVIDGSGVHQQALGYISGRDMMASPGPRPLSEYNGIGVGVSSKVGVIYFAASSARLDSNDLSVVREIAAYQRQYGGVLRVIGHSSSRTADMDPSHHTLVNLRVSAQRADSVARALMNAGVPGGQIFVGGVADEQKEYQEVMPSGEAFNRRTEVFLDY